MIRASIAVALCVACHIPDEQFRVGDGGTGDGSSDAATTGCDLTKPFNPPVAISELNDSLLSELTERLSHDELVIYYGTRPKNVSSGGEIVKATRSTPGGTFGLPTTLPIDDAAVQIDPSVTGDNLKLYYSSDKATPGINKIYLATRATTDLDFSNPAPVASLDTGTGDDEIDVYVMPNDQTLYLAIQVAGSPDYQLYASRRGTGGAAYLTPYDNAFGNINAAGTNNTSPVVTVDLLTLYFGSDRTGSQGTDIWKATRNSSGVGFGAPVNVTELNTTESEAPGWISDDGCRLYFSRTPTGAHDWKLFVATKPPKTM